MIFAKVQTNRSSLQKYMADFRSMHEPNEGLISPRPTAGSSQQFYYALVMLNDGSKMHQISKKFPKYKILNSAEFEAFKDEIVHSWKINIKSE